MYATSKSRKWDVNYRKCNIDWIARLSVNILTHRSMYTCTHIICVLVTMWQVHLSVYIYIPIYLSVCLSVHLDAIAFYPDNSTSFFPPIRFYRRFNYNHACILSVHQFWRQKLPRVCYTWQTFTTYILNESVSYSRRFLNFQG